MATPAPDQVWQEPTAAGVADVLSDQLGAVRARIARLQQLADLLDTARIIAHSELAGTAVDHPTDCPRVDPIADPGPDLFPDVDPVDEMLIPLDDEVVTFTVDNPTRWESTPPVDPSTRKKAPPAAKGSKYDLAEVARIARDGIKQGKRPADAVLEGTPQCPTRQTASWLVTEARKAGHNIHKAPRGPAAKPPAPVLRPVGESQVRGKVFACADCPAEFPEVVDLARHCRNTHNRTAERAERIPTAPSES